MTKKLGEIVFRGGPIYLKLQLFLKEWDLLYKKRNLKGDDCVRKFIKHFGELNEEQN